MSELAASVERFIAQEVHLLHDREWQQWLALFDEDGIYWMPATPDQEDPINHVSHIYETSTLRELRVRRLIDDIALSLKPLPRIVRYISNVLVTPDIGSDEVTARANILAAQYAYSSVQQFHGSVAWTLRRHDDTYRISLKRVDLINSDGYLSDILEYL